MQIYQTAKQQSYKNLLAANHQEAVNDGFSNSVIAEADACELRLLIKPDQDLGQKFETFDRDEQQMLASGALNLNLRARLF